MRHASIDSFLTAAPAALAKGPVALLFLEDNVEVASTLRHHLARGFRTVVALTYPGVRVPDDLAQAVHQVPVQAASETPVPDTVNQIIDAAAPGVWIYYGFNAEYLFHPFCETRTIGEMIAFNAEERRDTALCFVVDLYAGDLSRYPSAVSLQDAWLDRAGYYALLRQDADGAPLDRQMDFYGGLRWRFEEFIPPDRRRIDRVALFKSRPGLKLNRDHTFNDPEYNTYACPWHHSLTAAIASFRTAKALRSNPGSRYDIHGFRWRSSEPFRWSSRQLLSLGLMEPGQWF